MRPRESMTMMPSTAALMTARQRASERRSASRDGGGPGGVVIDEILSLNQSADGAKAHTIGGRIAIRHKQLIAPMPAADRARVADRTPVLLRSRCDLRH